MITQSSQSFAAASRAWFRLELTRLGQRATDFTSFGLPVFDEPSETTHEYREAVQTNDRIAPTAIVLLGLAELIFVAFLVGRTYGSLHPVWKVIVTLASAGIAAFSLRLIRLLRARKPRRPFANAVESPLNPS
jgi:hypothetical protein